MRRQILLVVVIGLLAVALSACPAPEPEGMPDLVPVKAPGNPTFCEIEGGNLKVFVKNQGTADASGSEVEVVFHMGDGVQQPVRGATGPISQGATDTVLIPIPAGCYNPDCDFTITVDIVNEINESNEGNNVAQGSCIG